MSRALRMASSTADGIAEQKVEHTDHPGPEREIREINSPDETRRHDELAARMVYQLDLPLGCLRRPRSKLT